MRAGAVHRPAPAPLLAAGAIVAVAAAAPVAYLLVVIAGEPASAWEAVWRGRTAGLLLRSVLLAAAVAAAATALAVVLAWLTTRTDLPGRRVWTVLTALPLVMPSYVLAYLFVSALGPRGVLGEAIGIGLPRVEGFAGAWLVLTLSTYPLVLLPVRSALAGLDPQLEEAARAMGRRPREVLATVVAPQLVPAAGAGALLSALYTLSDFGAVSIVRFDSFTRVIYQSYRASFDRTGAAALAALLVGVMIVLLAAERARRRRTAYHRSAPGAARPVRPVALGRWRGPAVALCATVVGVALVLPAGMLVHWSRQSVAGSVDWASVAAATGNSLLLAAMAAGIATLVALPVAWLGARHAGRASALVDAASTTGYALPGIVVALSLVFVAIRVLPAVYQTLGLLVAAMVLLFLPLSVGATRAALAQISPSLEEAARGAGRGPLAAAATITLPLAARGVLAGTALVFLAAIKELPAVVLLAPIGFDTLAVDIWQQTNRSFFESGAVPALILLAVSAPALWLLTERSR